MARITIDGETLEELPNENFPLIKVMPVTELDNDTAYLWVSFDNFVKIKNFGATQLAKSAAPSVERASDPSLDKKDFTGE